MERFGVADRGAQARVWAVRVCGATALAYLALTCVVIVADQVAQMPPRRPSAAESAAARPRAEAKWRLVREQLASRLTYRPAEFGAVWQSRSGRVCGTVTRMDARVFYRTRFYTDQKGAHFASDDERSFVRAWLDCVGDHWVDLKIDDDTVGWCAVPRNKPAPIARILCR